MQPALQRLLSDRERSVDCNPAQPTGAGHVLYENQAAVVTSVREAGSLDDRRSLPATDGAHWCTIVVATFSDRASMHPECRQSLP